jgi:hypothetical protein
VKVLGFIILHYGRPYLRAAVEAILPQVDHLVILYSPKPSQGFGTDTPCPDTEGELKQEAFDALDLQAIGLDGQSKIQWVRGHWHHEGEHTDAIWQYADGYDWIVRLDADEIFPPGMVAEMIAQAEETQHKNYCVPFVHFWRSFSRVNRDAQMPVRLARVNGGEGQRYLDSKGGKWFVYHFGYAQPSRYIQYKLQVSGHRPEFRPDWYEKKWLANAQEDLHPVNFPGFWNAEPFDKETMPEVLKRHPYFSMTVID